MRIPPAGFVADLQRRFGAEWNVKWSELYSRWVVTGPSAGGQQTEQVWGWFRKWNPETKQYDMVATGEDGLPPFRDLDMEAQGEIIANMERSYLFNRHEGDTTVKKRFARLTRDNDATKAKNVQQRASTFAHLLNEVNIRRPGWKKIHQRPSEPVLVAGPGGVFRTAQFDHS